MLTVERINIFLVSHSRNISNLPMLSLFSFVFLLLSKIYILSLKKVNRSKLKESFLNIFYSAEHIEYEECLSHSKIITYLINFKGS
jgi:hypothetical protein